MARQGQGRGFVVLIADDDPDDRALAADALEMSRSTSEVRFVADGEELLDYLRHEGPYEEGVVPRPDLILLDLNMPKRSGTEALAEIKRNESLRTIPVVVLSTSRRGDDISASYQLGAASYITKPSTFSDLVSTMGAFDRYWFDLVDLPQRG